MIIAINIHTTPSLTHMHPIDHHLINPRTSLPPHPNIHLPAQLLNSLDQPSPLFQLGPHVIDCLFQHHAFAPSLALEPGDKFGKSVEAFTDGLAALLLCARKWRLACPDEGIIKFADFGTEVGKGSSD